MWTHEIRRNCNFSLEEAKMIAEINPQMLSLRELYTVALSYTEDKARFYKIINISVKLYPVHPVANLNAAAAAIEQGDVKSAGKFLSMALHDSLAYKKLPRSIRTNVRKHLRRHPNAESRQSRRL